MDTGGLAQVYIPRLGRAEPGHPGSPGQTEPAQVPQVGYNAGEALRGAGTSRTETSTSGTFHLRRVEKGTREHRLPCRDRAPLSSCPLRTGQGSPRKSHTEPRQLGHITRAPDESSS